MTHCTMSTFITHSAATLVFITVAFLCPGQNDLTNKQRRQLQNYEDTLQQLQTDMYEARNANERKMKCFQLIPHLVKALSVRNSFEYPFDSLNLISIQYPADRSFRIFTWGIRLPKGSYRHYGSIQMNSDTLRLYPLYDKSVIISNPEDTILDHENWYGAKYYNIYQKQVWFKKYYYLFGWDAHSRRSDKKLLDVLHFNNNDHPLFGARRFVFNSDTTKKTTKTRFLLEYKQDAHVTLAYSQERNMIIYDHLVPLQGAKGVRALYVPDGTYEGFNHRWGKWHHINKIFHKTFEDPPGSRHSE